MRAQWVGSRAEMSASPYESDQKQWSRGLIDVLVREGCLRSLRFLTWKRPTARAQILARRFAANHAPEFFSFSSCISMTRETMIISPRSLQTSWRIWRGCVSKISGGSVYICTCIYACIDFTSVLQTNRKIRRRRVSKISGGSAYRCLYISYRWRGTERHCGLAPVSAFRQVVEKPCTVL